MYKAKVRKECVSKWDVDFVEVVEVKKGGMAAALNSRKFVYCNYFVFVGFIWEHKPHRQLVLVLKISRVIYYVVNLEKIIYVISRLGFT